MMLFRIYIIISIIAILDWTLMNKQRDLYDLYDFMVIALGAPIYLCYRVYFTIRNRLK